jgi:hypothetical protein
MEQLIIFLLFVVGSIISSILQHKKKKAEEAEQRELEEMTGRRRAGEPPPEVQQSPFPKTAADWQEQLRRMLEGEPEPPPKPPVIKPVLLPPVQPPPPQRSPYAPTTTARTDWEPKQKGAGVPNEILEGARTLVKTSGAHYESANLHEKVAKRMRAVSEQTVSHRPSPPEKYRMRAHSEFVRRLRKNPSAIREAFIASVIFNPPKGLESAGEDPARA